VPAEFAAVFAERAQSMAELRAAVDGFLGLQPIPPAGTAAATSSETASPAALLSATEATNRIAAAGALLARSDSLYRSVRRTLAASAGHARIPPSVWVRDPQLWRVGTVAADVDLMATSATLAATHYLAIRTVRLSPPVLPTPPGGSGAVAAVSPTTQIGATVVLADNGSVAEPHATVRFALADQSSGATATKVDTAALALGASVTLPTVDFRVKPGTTYVLTVSVVTPPGQTETDGTVFQQALTVAPAT
jgi:hypothetical protein